MTQSFEDVLEEMEEALDSYVIVNSEMNKQWQRNHDEAVEEAKARGDVQKLKYLLGEDYVSEDSETKSDISENISKISCDNFQNISQAREDLWTSRHVIYTCMDNGEDVSKPINFF